MTPSLLGRLYAASLLFSSCVTSTPKTLGLEFDIKAHQTKTTTSNERELLAAGGGSDNLRFAYHVNITVGTPPQNIRVRLDTGSSDLWFPSTNSQICRDHALVCLLAGTYIDDIEKSSTGIDTQRLFATEYFDGTGVNGTFITDLLEFYGKPLKDMQMGLATRGKEVAAGKVGNAMASASGILGIGFESAEAGVHFRNEAPYPNVVSQLVLNGHINTRAYSIWLNDHYSSWGYILFGGIDTSKYSGPLGLLPIVEDPLPGADSLRTAVQMTSLTRQDNSGSSSIISDGAIYLVTVDTGATLNILPKAVADPLYAAFGAVFDDRAGNLPWVSCDLMTANAKLKFGFGGPQGPKISACSSELVTSFTNNFYPGNYAFADGHAACLFGILATEEPSVFLGSPFLRSAYAVFDLENKQIAIAQSNNAAEPNGQPQAKEITNGSAGIPGVDRIMTAIPWPTSYVEEWRSYTSYTQEMATATSDVIPAPGEPSPTDGL